MAKTKTDETNEAPAMSKMDAVRAAIRGGAAMPQAGAAHVKERYGIDISPNVFSSHKTKVMRELAAEAGSPPPEPPKQADAVGQDAPKAAAPKAEAKPATPKAAPKPPADSGSPADLARQVKQLVEKYGAGSVREMADVFEG